MGQFSKHFMKFGSKWRPGKSWKSLKIFVTKRVVTLTLDLGRLVTPCACSA